MTEAYEGFVAFLDLGGVILEVVLVVTFILWVIIIERFIYLRWAHPGHAMRAIRQWQARSDRSSWFAAQIRRQRISQVRERLRSGLPALDVLITVCPLLGLLGTVSGMIEVFDVMAVAGSENPRAMAEGVSRATIPTMAGMVAALSGLYFRARLRRLAARRTRDLSEHLR